MATSFFGRKGARAEIKHFQRHQSQAAAAANGNMHVKRVSVMVPNEGRAADDHLREAS